MTVTSAGLREKIQGIARRYPFERYGWARAVRNGTITQHGQGLLITPQSSDDCFECFSSSLALRDELNREGYQASTYRLRIEVREEVPVYHHGVTKIDLGDTVVLAGFSPFELLLGCYPERVMAREEWDRFAIRLDAQRYHGLADRDDETLPDGALLVQRSTRQRYYPFAFQPADDGGALLEFSHWHDHGRGGFLALRVSRLALSQSGLTLDRLGLLSFKFCFPNFQRATSFANPETTESGSDPLLRSAATAHWPDFIKLAEALNSTLYR